MPIVRSAAPLDAEAPWLEALSALRQLGRELHSLGADEAACEASFQLIEDRVGQWLPGALAFISLGASACAEHAAPAHRTGSASSGPRSGESMCFPLQVHGETLGALHVQLSGERACSQTERLLLQILCDYAALALHSARHAAAPSPDRITPFPVAAPCSLAGCAAPGGGAPRVPPPSDGVDAFPPKLNRASEIDTASQSEPGGSLAVLTAREREVLALLAEGMTNKQIAFALVITPNTVKRHLKAIFEKLCVRTRSAAAARAISARFPA